MYILLENNISDGAYFGDMVDLYSAITLLSLYAFWTLTQYFLEKDDNPSNKIIDRVHKFSLCKSINKYLLNNVVLTKCLLILTTLMIDVNILYYCYDFLFNNNVLPIYLLFAGIILRQVCQSIVKIPIPKNIIWYNPNFPTLLMNYSVSNDFFFSGHTLTSLIFGFEMYKSSNYFVKAYALFFMFGEILFVLVTRSHYFMDVYASIATYFMLRYFIN